MNDQTSIPDLPEFKPMVAIDAKVLHMVSIILMFHKLDNQVQKDFCLGLTKKIAVLFHTMSCEMVAEQEPGLIDEAHAQLADVAKLFQDIDCRGL